jgi:hypothetical protein
MRMPKLLLDLLLAAALSIMTAPDSQELRRAE